MTTKQTEAISTTRALKLALEALEWMEDNEGLSFETEITAIKEALAERPSQQPVAMRYDFDGYGYKYIDAGSGSDWQTRIKDAEPVYASPQPAQQREPVALDVTIEGDSAKLLASMLEPVLDDEPTPIRLLVGNGHSGHGLYVAAAEYQEEGVVLLVNTSPPASKPWVGLTDEEMNAALDYWSEDERSAYGGAHAADGEYVSMIDTWRYIEAKLKEKNGF